MSGRRQRQAGCGEQLHPLSTLRSSRLGAARGTGPRSPRSILRPSPSPATGTLRHRLLRNVRASEQLLRAALPRRSTSDAQAPTATQTRSRLTSTTSHGRHRHPAPVHPPTASASATSRRQHGSIRKDLRLQLRAAARLRGSCSTCACSSCVPATIGQALCGLLTYLFSYLCQASHRSAMSTRPASSRAHTCESPRGADDTLRKLSMSLLRSSVPDCLAPQMTSRRWWTYALVVSFMIALNLLVAEAVGLVPTQSASNPRASYTPPLLLCAALIGCPSPFDSCADTLTFTSSAAAAAASAGRGGGGPKSRPPRYRRQLKCT